MDVAASFVRARAEQYLYGLLGLDEDDEGGSEAVDTFAFEAVLEALLAVGALERADLESWRGDDAGAVYRWAGGSGGGWSVQRPRLAG